MAPNSSAPASSESIRITGHAVRADRYGIERWLAEVRVNGRVVATTSRLSERHAVAWVKVQVAILERRLANEASATTT